MGVAGEVREWAVSGGGGGGGGKWSQALQPAWTDEGGGEEDE